MAIRGLSGIALLGLVIALTTTTHLRATRVGGQAGAPRPTAVAVWKDAACGCCALWMDHLRRNGFTASHTNLDPNALSALKDKHGVPAQGRSCHTAVVDGFVIEGHVPASEVHRLLKTRPAGVVGLAVAGMPPGSPGMESPNPRPYNVLAFDKQGRTSIFSTQNPR
jgi:hypothetical protein